MAYQTTQRPHIERLDHLFAEPLMHSTPKNTPPPEQNAQEAGSTTNPLTVSD